MRHAADTSPGILEEKRRRLLAGPVSMCNGHGGDRHVGRRLGLYPATVAKGRKQLPTGDIATGRVRRTSGGRKPIKKQVRNLAFHAALQRRIVEPARKRELSLGIFFPEEACQLRAAVYPFCSRHGSIPFRLPAAGAEGRFSRMLEYHHGRTATADRYRRCFLHRLESSLN